MVLKANYEFLFVGKDENSFLENYAYDLFQDHGENSGQIFINLEVQNNPVDGEEIGKVIFETMQKVFFEDLALPAYDRFENALKAINSILNEFKGQKVSGYIGNLNVVVASIVGDELLLTQCGEAEAYLIRKRYVSIVSEGLDEQSGQSGDVFSSIASGKIETGDFILFASTRLLRYVSKTDLAQCVNKKSVNESLVQLQDIISTEILGKVGLTGILFNKPSDEEIRETLDGENTSRQSVLEADRGYVSAKKGTLSGKFLNIFKGYKSNRTEVFQKSGNFFGSIFEWIGNLFSSLFKRGFGKDKILVLLVVLIVILSAGIVWANNNRAQKAELAKLDNILQDVQTKVSEAQTRSSYDKDSAKDLLDQAYSSAKSVLDTPYFHEKAGLYLLQIEEARDKLDEVKRIENPVVLADLSTKRSDVNALGFALVKDRVFVYEYNALYEIVLDQIQDPLTIDDKEMVIAATGFEDRGSVIFLTKSGKLIEYKDGNVSFMDSEDSAFHPGIKIADWSNRIYILDQQGGQIWRYTYKGTRGAFGPAEGYLSEVMDFSAVKDFAIDSKLYLLKNTGEIEKFYAGSKLEFVVKSPPFNLFKDPTAIYTDDKLDDVYVLDSKDSRILVYAKDTKTENLEYKQQYFMPDVGELRDVYVDADSKTMYVLTKSKVVKVDL